MILLQLSKYIEMSVVMIIFNLSHLMNYRKAAKSLKLMLILQIFDGLNCVSQGNLRGMGRQSVAACINGIAFYVFGLPLAYFFAFYLEWNLAGLWGGMTLGCGFGFSIYYFILSRVNWQQMAANAKELVSK